MQETRYDWLADRWVLFAPNREERPNEYSCQQVPSSANPLDCPFCAGAESKTPEPTLVLPITDLEASRRLRRDEHDRTTRQASQNWKVRVVPNKYPAVLAYSLNGLYAQQAAFDSSNESVFAARSTHGQNGRITHATPQEAALLVESSELFRKDVPTGVHEVFIESPEHIQSITSLPLDHVDLILQAYKIRLQHFRSQRELEYGVIFKNHGFDAGASLTHAHSQLVCLGFVPSDVQRRHRRMLHYFEKHETCYFCQLAIEEEKLNDRIVLASEHFVAYCPFASRFPFEMMIQPRTHRSHFEETSPNEIRDLAYVLKSVLAALESSQPSLAYNLVLNTSPFNCFHPLAHHWTIQVIPRASKLAGFELGSECFINTTKPEQTASLLRQASSLLS
jgi:UDPglucose--hexose-1-phosphate uridylyltransferase